MLMFSGIYSTVYTAGHNGVCFLEWKHFVVIHCTMYMSRVQYFIKTLVEVQEKDECYMEALVVLNSPKCLRVFSLNK